MEKEKCVNCGRFIGSYSAKIKGDYGNKKKGDTIDIRGCKWCKDFTLE